MLKEFFFSVFLVLVITPFFSFAQEPQFKVTNEMIYQKLIEIEKRQAVFEERFKQIDKRFEEQNKRFEDLNESFRQLIRLMGWIVGGMFGVLGVFVGLLLWDRRTAVSSAIRESEKRLEGKFNLSDLPKLIAALRELAKTDKRLEGILRQFHLL